MRFLVALFVTASLSLTGCAKYEGMSAEAIADDMFQTGMDKSNEAKMIVWCQAKAISESGLPKHIIEKITHAGDPVEQAKDFGYKKLYRQMKACI